MKRKKPSAAKRNNSKITQLQMLCFVVMLTNNFVAKCVLIKARHNQNTNEY